MRDSRELLLKTLPENLFPKTWGVLRQGIADHVAPGIVAGIWSARTSEEILVAALGCRRVEPSSQPVFQETPFDLASLTKVMATATLAAVLVERGWIDWSTPLRALLPEVPSRDIELRHLLSHTAGFAAWAPFWESLRGKFAPQPLEQVPVSERQAAMRKLVCAVEPEVGVEQRALYSDISFLLLGFALEEALRMPLDRATRRFLWEPMGLSSPLDSKGARFFHANRPASFVREEFAATEFSDWRGAILQGQVHDDNAWAMGGYGGHAGVFGSVRDVLFFAKRLLEGFLSPATLRAAWTKVPKPESCERTLGWDTPSGAGSVALGFPPQSVGHLGFTGTSLWIDPINRIAVALLTNRVHFGRDNTGIRALRPCFHQAIHAEILARDQDLRSGNYFRDGF